MGLVYGIVCIPFLFASAMASNNAEVSWERLLGCATFSQNKKE